jgi:hypothetical protein
MKISDQSRKEQSESFRIALFMANVETDQKGAYIALRVWDKLLEMNGNFDLETAAKIHAEAEEMFKLEENA